MHTFAMILDNPGEQPHETRYREPGRLRELGYSDLIVYPTTGLSGLLGPDTPASTDVQRWVGQQYESIRQTAGQARRAGLGVWLMYDAPSLAAELVGSAMTCVNQQPVTLCPASDELLEMSGQCLEALLTEIEPVDGVVLRLGDNDAAKVGYLIGNDVYGPHCARCSGMGPAERIGRFARFFHELIVGKLGRKMILRTWNVRPGGMHDDAELCRRVVERLPEDPGLMLSFKFTQTDFWRYQRWNGSSLVCGDRPVIYELQCQREFEGKGAAPNYQPPLWRDGMGELPGAEGLAQVHDRINLAGLWAWVRGGGWRGPYVDRANETWIDANVVAVPQLAETPSADPAELAERWVRDRLGCEGEAAEAVMQVLRDSDRTALEAFYVGPYARALQDGWHPSANFIQDDLIDAEALWALLRRLPDEALDEAVREKAEALERVEQDQRAVHRIAEQLPGSLRETVPRALDYAETLVGTLRHLVAGLVAYRRWLRRRDPSLASAAEQAMRHCQSRWVHHTQRIATRGGASPFDSDNLWDVTQRVVDELHAGQRR